MNPPVLQAYTGDVLQMSKIFLDLDGTVRRTKSGATFINEPFDQELIPGVKEAIARHQDDIIIGITNQGGVGAGFKTIKNCLLEQQETLRLIPEMVAIYLCPDGGNSLWAVGRDEQGFKTHEFLRTRFYQAFRKPDCGMLQYACTDLFNSEIPLSSLMVGDRPEDEQAAKNAGINFMWAEDWRNGT